MQYLGSKIGQLRCLLKAELRNGARILNHTRVAGIDAADVRPYLNSFCIQSCPDEAGRVVRTLKAQGRGIPLVVLSVEAAHNGDGRLGKRLQLFSRLLIYRCGIRLGFLEVRVGADKRADIDPPGGQAISLPAPGKEIR